MTEATDPEVPSRAACDKVPELGRWHDASRYGLIRTHNKGTRGRGPAVGIVSPSETVVGAPPRHCDIGELGGSAVHALSESARGSSKRAKRGRLTLEELE